MILAFRRPCADHRTTLLDWVDRREIGRRTAAALAHLDRCPRCERDLAASALTIHALRGVGRDLAAAEPSPDAWLRLRARITRRADPWRWRATLAGSATSALLVAVLVMPITIGGPFVRPSADAPRAELAERKHEAAYLAGIRDGELPPTPHVERGVGGVPRTYPDEIARVRKEVASTRPIHRPSAPI
jgi:hypothetical protein